jgi:hypothetical protein
MIELHPNIGITGLGGRRWDSLPNLRGQRHDLVAFLLQLCLPMGLIDMAGKLALPETGLSGGYVVFSANRSQAKPWVPPPTHMAFRLTPIGKAALLGTAAPEEKASTEQLHVTPDFFVVVPVRADPALLLLLGKAAISMPMQAGDPVRQFRLERERWVQSLQSGLNAEEFMTKLEKATGRPLPALNRCTRSTSNSRVREARPWLTTQSLAVVPPMSNARIRSRPESFAKNAAASTPAAGPDSTICTGTRLAVSMVAVPPLDSMTSSRRE